MSALIYTDGDGGDWIWGYAPDEAGRLTAMCYIIPDVCQHVREGVVGDCDDDCPLDGQVSLKWLGSWPDPNTYAGTYASRYGKGGAQAEADRLYHAHMAGTHDARAKFLSYSPAKVQS